MSSSISYMKLIMSVGMIAFVAALVVGGTGAFFNDTETSTGNVFTAGAIDLKVDSVGHVNGLVCYEGKWASEVAVQWNETDEVLEVVGDLVAENDAYNQAFPSNVPQAGDDCASTWAETDLGVETFFSFADLKPGDNGENTISLHVYDNDAYACAIIDDMVDADNGLTEPEAEDGDVTPELGELSQELRFFAWADDGDNVYEPGSNERPLFSNIEGPASDVIDGVVYPLFTPQTEVLKATTTQYIGLYWCYGAISTVDGVLSCDGSEVTNITQTDSLSASFTFYVEQARNNENFQCPVLETPPVAGPVIVDTYGIGFEPLAYAVGDINGQDGWSKTGGYDAAVVDNPVISDLQSLRISNAVTSGSFGDQTIAPELAESAGETGVATNNYYEAEFQISSTDLNEQPGLVLSVSPDDGAGSRMSYLSFADEAGGIRVTFYDVTNAGPLPTVSSFNPTDLGLLDRSTAHTIKFAIEFVDGPGNDIVQIYIDNVLVHTGTTWEDYYRFDGEQTGNGNVLFPVDSLIIPVRGTAVPTTLGGGYLFDNVSLSVGTI
ncbi:MAG: SipW-dependent-type signal peptide-containing protein [Candidatus Kaiserbacteria bacterium]|nr:SipW-dependent-type signal peptide-containing protein [Candidatus Kaiserbacteria bacterium]MCB9816887.1 hypothetical protein [Candidatus Nomurabacteria bacterium]